jgi:hypothetical protein
LVCEKRANHPNRAGYRNAGKTRVPGGGNGEHDQPVERQAGSKRPGQNDAPFENSTDPKDEAAARRVTRKRKYFFGKNFQRNEVLEPLGREPKPVVCNAVFAMQRQIAALIVESIPFSTTYESPGGLARESLGGLARRHSIPT